MTSAFKKLIPTFNRILVKKFEAETKTKSGILLTQAPDTNIVAKVITAGPGNL